MHALVGENGAGKSTLIKVMGGVHTPDEGKLYLDNNVVNFSSPRDAIGKGIIAIHQELSLVPDLSIEENILLGYYPVTRFGSISRPELRKRASAAIEKIGLDIDPKLPVRVLSVLGSRWLKLPER